MFGPMPPAYIRCEWPAAAPRQVRHPPAIEQISALGAAWMGDAEGRNVFENFMDHRAGFLSALHLFSQQQKRLHTSCCTSVSASARGVATFGRQVFFYLAFLSAHNNKVTPSSFFSLFRSLTISARRARVVLSFRLERRFSFSPSLNPGLLHFQVN